MRFILISCSLLSLLLFLGNKNGRATAAKEGNTGAPGDVTLAGGQPKTCGACHIPGINGTIVMDSVQIQVLGPTGAPISSYIPNEEYIARVRVHAHGNGLAAYGFQMIALRTSDNTDLKKFSDAGPNNYKLYTVPGSSRIYAEHGSPSTSNTFDVEWTAPDVGTGSVSFYAAANAVNNNNATGGDATAHRSLAIEEGQASVASEPEQDLAPRMRSDAPGELMLEYQSAVAGKVQVTVYSMSGKLLQTIWHTAQVGSNQVFLQQLPVGAGILHLRANRTSTTVKFVL